MSWLTRRPTATDQNGTETMTPTAHPTDTADPTAGLPAGHDEPHGPYWVPERLHAHYVADPGDVAAALNDSRTLQRARSLNTDDELTAYRDSLGPRPDRGLRDTRDQRVGERRQQLLLDRRTTPASPADIERAVHLLRMGRAIATDQQQTRARQADAAWRAAHTCQLCGVAADDVHDWQLLTLERANVGGPTRHQLGARVDVECALALLHARLQGAAGDTLPDGRTRADAAHEWLHPADTEHQGDTGAVSIRDAMAASRARGDGLHRLEVGTSPARASGPGATMH